MADARKPLHVGIVGAGLSGLVFHHYLRQRFAGAGLPLVTTMLEAGSSVGGVIQTERRDGFTLEHGPDCFITDKPQAIELARELGLEARLISTRARYRKSYIAKGNALHPVPEGLYLMAPTRMAPFLLSPLMSLRGKLRALAEAFVPRRRDGAEESLSAFVERRFGREMLERVAQPMIAGIYTGDPERLSLAATMPRFLQLEREHGSVIRGLLRSAMRKGTSGPRYSLFMSFDGGMNVLTSRLLEASYPTRLLLNAPARRINPLAGDRWKIHADTEDIEVDALCVCTPGHEAFGLVEDTELESSSVAILHFAFQRAQLGVDFDGMGFVVPSVERRDVLACSFLGHKFDGRAPEGYELIRVFCGGKLNEPLLERSDAEIAAAALRELRAWLKISGEPAWSTLKRWQRRMPQYNLGHSARTQKRSEQAAKFPTAFFCGNYFDGVGMPDVIRRAKATAEQAFAALTRP